MFKGVQSLLITYGCIWLYTTANVFADSCPSSGLIWGNWEKICFSWRIFFKEIWPQDSRNLDKPFGKWAFLSFLWNTSHSCNELTLLLQFLEMRALGRLNYWSPKNPKHYWKVMLDKLRKGVFHIHYCISCVLVKLITLQMLIIYFSCANHIRWLLLNPTAGFSRAEMHYDSVSTAWSLWPIVVLQVLYRNGCHFAVHVI